MLFATLRIVASIGTAYGICSLFTYDSPLAFLCTWCGLQFSVIVLFIFQLLRPAKTAILDGLFAVTSLMPLLTLVIGASYNLAQITGNSGLDLSSYWFDIFGLNALGNLVAILVTFCCIPFSPPRTTFWTSSTLRVIVFLCAATALNFTAQHVPDA